MLQDVAGCCRNVGANVAICEEMCNDLPVHGAIVAPPSAVQVLAGEEAAQTKQA